MFTFKEPLSQSPNCMFSRRYVQPGDLGSDQELLADIAERVCEQAWREAGISVAATTAPIEVGGFFNKKEVAGINLSFTEHPDYASILVGGSRAGNALNIDVLVHGTPSRGWQSTHMGNRWEQTYRRGGMGATVSDALRSAMIDTDAVEEESACYSIVTRYLVDMLG